jgi:hypothetical protein
MTGDSYARLGAPAGASIAADVAAVKTETSGIKTKTDSLSFTGTDVRATLDGETVGISANAVSASALASDAVTEIANGLVGTTLSELSQGQPPSSPTVAQALMLLYMALRNAGSMNSSTGYQTITNDAGTVIAKASLSDDGTTFTKTKLVTGP